VSKINHIAGEDAYAISLDPKEISDANWIETENKYKIGNVCHGTIIAKRTWEYVVQLVSGIRGLLPARELNTYVRNLSSPPHEVIGLELEVVVSGYRAEKRFLSLSIEGTRALSTCQLSNNYIGEKSSGVCAYKTLSYSLIEIQPDTYGILHKLNTWGDELPEVGEPVSVIIAGIENSQIFLTKEPRRVLDRIFFARPSLKEKWDVVINDYPVGRSAELQILYWRETNQSYMVVTQDGVVGFLPGKEISWRCTSLEEQRHVFNPGDTLHAAVLKVKQTKKHLVFSKKYLDKNSIDEHFLLLSLEKPIEGVIVKTVDFGCFVSLLPSGIQALLHRSKIPVGRTFSEGQSYMFYIDSLDQVNKRVSVRLNEP
jgi:ribosomal protein S1